jgi:hypothetical protein
MHDGNFLSHETEQKNISKHAKDDKILKSDQINNLLLGLKSISMLEAIK